MVFGLSNLNSSVYYCVFLSSNWMLWIEFRWWQCDKGLYKAFWSYTSFSSLMELHVLSLISINDLHKWLPIHYSFVLVQIWLPSSLSFAKLKRIFFSNIRLGRLMCTIIENSHHFWIWSTGILMQNHKIVTGIALLRHYSVCVEHP